MKISGFTIVRNAVKYDYPIVEAIGSVLPLCDEFVVSIGNSEDETEALIAGIQSPKIKIVRSVWDDTLREGGKVLAVETDKAKQCISPDTDWCFYIQADEVLHESSYENIRRALHDNNSNKNVEGLLFNYLHFFGSYNYVADAYNWYRHEIRLVRNNPSIVSWGDAQGFRLKTAEGRFRKLRVKPVEATIHHYGWVKDPHAQQRKQENFHKLWHNDEWIEKNVEKAEAYDYNTIDSLQQFSGVHPAVMQPRVNSRQWHFEFDVNKSRMKWRYRLRRWIEKKFGIQIGTYKNYKLC